MRIFGHWLACDDGETRPVLPAKIVAQSGDRVGCTFLVDPGADNTVLPAELVRDVGLPFVPSSVRLGGVGGVVGAVKVHPQLEFMKDDGSPIVISVECFAFTTDTALDLPILGRDVLNLFAVLLDYQSRTVALVRDRHRYVIQES